MTVNSKVAKANKNGKTAPGLIEGESDSFPFNSSQSLSFPAHPRYKHLVRERSPLPEETLFGL